MVLLYFAAKPFRRPPRGQHRADCAYIRSASGAFLIDFSARLRHASQEEEEFSHQLAWREGAASKRSCIASIHTSTLPCERLSMAAKSACRLPAPPAPCLPIYHSILFSKCLFASGLTGRGRAGARSFSSIMGACPVEWHDDSAAFFRCRRNRAALGGEIPR